jgi:hypothetical protein
VVEYECSVGTATDVELDTVRSRNTNKIERRERVSQVGDDERTSDGCHGSHLSRST